MTGAPPDDAARGRGVLERERELAEIERALDAAAAGRGQLLVVEGPSGIGKSTLLEAMRARAGGRGFDVLHTRPGELEQTFPFGVVYGLLETRLLRTDDEERARLLRGRAALAAPLLTRAGAPGGDRATPDTFALLHGLYWCVVNLCEQRPTLVIVDDVHWADELSLRFLVFLAQRLHDLPVALALGVRSGEPTAAAELVMMLVAAGSRPPLRPRELSLGAVREMLAGSGLEIAADESFVRASGRATGGNPLLVRELAAAMRDDPEPWRDAAPERLERFAPEAVGRGVVLRLRRLGGDAVAFAQAAAVLGEQATVPSVARLAGLEPARAADAVARLRETRMLGDGDPIAFAHPMIRSAVYDTTPSAARAALHRDAARLLRDRGAAAEQAAHHLLAAAPADERWIVDALHDGARAAAGMGSPRTAVRFLRRALELTEASERSPTLLIDLGIAEASAGETTSLERFEEALSRLSDVPERARAMYALGQTLYRYGRHAAAAETFRRGVDLFAREDDELGRTFEGAFLCCASYVAPMWAEAAARLPAAARDVGDEAAPSASQRVLLANVGFHRSTAIAPAADAAELLLRALGDDALLLAQTSESMAVNLSMIALVWCGRAAAAEPIADAVVADARRRGAALALAEASYVRALVSHARGRVEDAIADAETAIEGTRRGWQTTLPAPHAILADCLVERDDLAAAETVLEEASALLAPTASRVLNSWYFWARGRLRLTRSELAGALADFLEVGAILAAYGMTNPTIVPWRTRAAIAAHGLGRHDQALALVEEDLALARRFDLPAAIGTALRARGLVTAGRDGERDLRAAVAVLERADAPLELARALVDLGGALRRGGRRVESREPLRRALELAHRCGSSALQARAREELLASGARPRRTHVTGPDALTPSERRIATLAAAGHTNRQIAETLFLTKNTVEWHLGHVYRKLGIASRAELAGALHAGARPQETGG